MKASELRIGNLILIEQNTMRVSGIIDIPIFGHHVICGENEYDFIHASPIPLTEEWLVKFGFAIASCVSTMGYSSRQFMFKDFHITMSTHSGMGYKTIGEDEFCYGLNVIKHVHQLQNLYFALTGEELTIK